MNKLKTIFSFFKPAPKGPPSETGFFEAETRVVCSPDNARGVLDIVVTYMKEKQGYLQAADLFPVLKMTGRNRAWIHIEINRMIEESRLVYDEDSSRYEIMF